MKQFSIPARLKDESPMKNGILLLSQADTFYQNWFAY